VIADIPGIIEGAADGQGLGLTFLRHVERTRVLFHILTWDPAPERAPVRDFDALMNELVKFDPELAQRPMIVGISKTDLAETREVMEEATLELRARGLEVFPFCSATNEGVDAVLLRLEQLLRDNPASFVRTKSYWKASERPALHGDGKPADQESS
jgi:GTPase